jgi:hypothetical protein
MLETRTLFVTTQVARKNKHPKPPQHPKSKSPKKIKILVQLVQQTYVLLAKFEVHKSTYT